MKSNPNGSGSGDNRDRVQAFETGLIVFFELLSWSNALLIVRAAG